MLNKLYDFLNTISVTAWIVVIYAIKEKWTLNLHFSIFKEEWMINTQIHCFLLGLGLLIFTIALGALSLYLTKFLGKENLEECIEIEQADASFLPVYIGYFLITFSISNVHQLLVAFTFISIFLYLVRWQYFNVTYLLFGYHCYHVKTHKNTKLFIICRKEIRTPDNLRFSCLHRINNTTYIERGK